MGTAPTVLEDAERAAALATLTGWSYDDGQLKRTFRFKSFVEAFAFMTAGALAAERLDHHPDWSNAYRTVDVRLSTHSAGGVTRLDVELARAMDAAAVRLLG
ncbi:MAG: 4a-hydroxytetrahydrobiopterin dehydratase [Ardenticatenales bacterium]